MADGSSSGPREGAQIEIDDEPDDAVWTEVHREPSAVQRWLDQYPAGWCEEYGYAYTVRCGRVMRCAST
jgi:hypothetical protein